MWNNKQVISVSWDNFKWLVVGWVVAGRIWDVGVPMTTVVVHGSVLLTVGHRNYVFFGIFGIHAAFQNVCQEHEHGEYVREPKSGFGFHVQPICDELFASERVDWHQDFLLREAVDGQTNPVDDEPDADWAFGTTGFEESPTEDVGVQDKKKPEGEHGLDHAELLSNFQVLHQEDDVPAGHRGDDDFGQKWKQNVFAGPHFEAANRFQLKQESAIWRNWTRSQRNCLYLT